MRGVYAAIGVNYTKPLPISPIALTGLGHVIQLKHPHHRFSRNKPVFEHQIKIEEKEKSVTTRVPL